MKKFLYITLLILLSQACKNEEVNAITKEISFQLINKDNTFLAGEDIQIQFSGDTASLPYLWIKNAYGSSILEPVIEDDQLTFNLPKPFSKKSGVCTWQLLHNNRLHTNGKIIIKPNPYRKTQIESYLGPPSITVGGIDYTMLVTAPTDIYDNPLADATQVSVKKQFNSTIEEATVISKNGIAWKNLYSPKISGRLLIAASSNKTTSKELTAIVQPTNATDFNIDYQSNHNYADGNQVITFSTDIIKDEFENIVSDGTLVTFTITDSKKMRLHTTGTTINGMAKGQLLHPNEPTEWSVKAYITGAAQSNTITIGFKPILKDYNMVFSNDRRTIRISQMYSFMGQLVPDGIPLTIEIRNKNGLLLDTHRTTSRLGKAWFTFSEDFYPNATYELKISTAGIVKIKTVQLQ